METTPKQPRRQSKDRRTSADPARNNAAKDTVSAVKEIYANLAQKRDEIQEMMATAERIRSEADDYHRRLIEQAHKQAQKIMSEANKIKAEGEAYYSRVSAEAKTMLMEAEKAKAEAEAYRQDIMATTRELSSNNMSLSQLADQYRASDTAPASSPKVPDQPHQSSSDRDTNPQQTPAMGRQPDTNGNLDPHELILGVYLGGASKAFPLEAIMDAGLINDSIAGHPVGFAYEPSLEAAMAFSRDIDNMTLSFVPVRKGPGMMMLMSDQQTGTTWEVLTRRAIEGPLKGKILARVGSEHISWSTWKQLHPDTRVYQPGA